MNDANVWRTASSSRGKAPRRQQQQNKATEVRQNSVEYDNSSIYTSAKSLLKDPMGRSHNNGNNSNSSFALKNGEAQRNSPYKTQKAQPPAPANIQNGHGGPKTLEKEVKSLLKHEASVERARWLFNEEISKSEDRLKRAFKELRELLDQRETKLLTELQLCKTEGLLILDNREQTGREFKAQTERAAKMNDRELGEIRQNIKRLVNDERRLEDLGRTLRFQFEPDKLVDLISGFGEVIPITGAPKKSCSVNSLISGDSADASVASSDVGKAVNQVMIGGFLIQSDSMDTSQLTDLTRQLQESLKMQGITDDIIPEVTGSSGAMPQRRRPPAPSVSVAANGRNGSSKQSASRR